MGLISDNLLNKKAPTFTLPSSEKRPISVKDYKGQFLIVYFYLKNETSGCALEALAFKEKYWEMTDNNIALIGISPDDIKSHCAFIEHYDLPYPLLSDLNHDVAKNYGVWRQKTNYGREFWGAERTTFIIDKDGIIRAIVENTKPNDHATRAIEEIKKLES